jgi:hypothetical protein
MLGFFLSFANLYREKSALVHRRGCAASCQSPYKFGQFDRRDRSD